LAVLATIFTLAIAWFYHTALLGLLALVIVAIGVGGVALVRTRPMLALVCMVVSAVLGYVVEYIIYVLPTLLFLAGAVLVFLDLLRQRSTVPHHEV